MNIEAFSGMVGRKLSVATNKLKPDGAPESYIAYLEHIGADYIVLDYASASINNPYSISKVLLLAESITGVWVYEE